MFCERAKSSAPQPKSVAQPKTFAQPGDPGYQPPRPPATSSKVEEFGGRLWAAQSEKVQKHTAIGFGIVLVGTVAVVIIGVLWLAISWLADLGGDSGGNSCESLQSWYASSPGDSNLTIARDYYRLCDTLPPPVLSGELVIVNGRISTR